MKKLLMLVALSTSSAVLANNPVSVNELQQLQIKDVSQLPSSGFTQTNELNGAQSVRKDQVIIGENGLNAYQATGEVLIQLAAFADADEVAKAHGLTLTQAYKSFYVVTSKQDNLAQVLAALQQDGTVVSASLGLKDLGVKVN
ncbi:MULTISPECIES: hypothetical protein [Pseudoalteromonas]|uniref:ASP external chaperone domain-containing protein n=1 Tax=Pseudoalteromonas amylolytica TaxID=1859457 RepID=A0A1S1MXF3_9GAMM|nr:MULTISPECIES: hypothetical protein [Pseudoalteromonas]OHU84972.1 hypothetical protein BFC16_19990 [Pseudoalteromonas sp. JW3]OHU90077.1 hypothetical protein BET10_14985 [Pseudoalteromonas amylolytica]